MVVPSNGFKVLTTGFFVYCNGLADKDVFDQKLEFDVKIISYEGNDSWVEPTLLAAQKCLSSDTIPSAHEDCDFCNYNTLVSEVTK